MTPPKRSALVNGRPGDLLPLAERGLNYGDGLFETLAVRRGRALCLERHLERLRAGCERLGLPFPDADLLRREAACLLEGVARGVLKIYWTRGPGGRGYAPPATPRPTRVLSLHPWPARLRDYPPEGLKVRFCKLRLGHQPALAGIKHLNRLEQVLARAEWDDPAIHEGLMLDYQGRVTGGTMSNLFFGKDGVLYTPPLEQCAVAGVLRAEILEAASGLDLCCRTAEVTPQDLERADEIFLSNSLIGIRPVAGLAGRRLPPGPLVTCLREVLERDGRIMLR